MYEKTNLGIPVSKEVDSNVFKAELIIRVIHAETKKDLEEDRNIAIREYPAEIEEKHLQVLLANPIYKNAKISNIEKL